MTDLRPWFGVLVLMALAFWLGRSVIACTTSERPRLAESFAAGVLGIHGWLLLMDWVAVPWSAGVILAPAAAAFVLGRAGGQKEAVVATPAPWTFWEWLAAAGLALFCWSAVTLRSLAPDFVYHWGFKGRRFFETSGVDWAILEQPGGGYLHPDYPLLLPNLSAASAKLGEQWCEPALMLWSVVAFALMILEMRNALTDFSVSEVGSRIILTASVWILAAFSMAHYQAGAADIQFGLCLLGVSRELAQLFRYPERPARLWRLGLWAALGLATKIEGAPLAVFAVLCAAGLIAFGKGHSGKAHLGRKAPWRSILLKVRRTWPLLGLSALFGGWWLLGLYSHDLFQASNIGVPTIHRIGETFSALPQALSISSWTGFAWLVMFLPLLLASRKTRFFVCLASLQLGFYLASYFGGEQATRFWVLSSLPRLVFHLMPVILVSIGVHLTERGWGLDGEGSFNATGTIEEGP